MLLTADLRQMEFSFRFHNVFRKLTFARESRSALACVICLVVLVIGSSVSADTWQGLTIEPEFRCSPYNSKEYSYPQSVEPQIIEMIGKIYSPYTGRCFTSRYETDIEHIVARSEAHDSGLCAASRDVRRKFSSDLLNLTLASPQVNRRQKVAHDAAGWVPKLNQCWFASTVVAVKQKYGLSVDRREAHALQRILSQCSSTQMVVGECVDMEPTSGTQSSGEQPESDALAKWDDNRNGRITCKEARRHGIAPVPRDHPAYRYMRDGDGDGVVCE